MIEKTDDYVMKNRVLLVGSIVIYIVLVFFLWTLIWKYPAAAVLFPLYLIYGAVCLILYLYLKKKKNKKKISMLSFLKCSLLMLVTDVYGLVSEGDSYLVFNLLSCADGIAMIVDLIFRIIAAVTQAQKDVKQKIPALFCNPLFYIILYIILGAVLPFTYQPQMSDSTMESVDCSIFYSDTSSGERARVISQNGEALEERIRLISQAEDEIILSTFEIRSDTSGKQVMAALMEAADRGVHVCVLLDGFPYMKAMWGNPYFLALAQTNNVEIRVYNPIRPWKPWTFMGRLHDKYLIADDQAYILGGRNTYDYFLGDQKGYKNYDWDVLTYSGEAEEDNSLEQVRDYFASVWKMSVCKAVRANDFWKINPTVISAKEELETIYEDMVSEHSDWLMAIDYESVTVPVNHIELVSNPTHIFAKEPVVYYTMTELMMQATESVKFHTPYIICNDWMLERLEAVCDKVENTTMMTNSVANNGNPFGASDYSLNKKDILSTGVQILEYDGGISYHGKCFVIDDCLSGIGSFNWDMRSAYVDTELMLVVDSEALNLQLREEMESYEENALTVIDADTSVAPAGKEAQEISDKRWKRIQILRYFNWGRFLM